MNFKIMKLRNGNCFVRWKRIEGKRRSEAISRGGEENSCAKMGGGGGGGGEKERTAARSRRSIDSQRLIFEARARVAALFRGVHHAA